MNSTDNKLGQVLLVERRIADFKRGKLSLPPKSKLVFTNINSGIANDTVFSTASELMPTEVALIQSMRRSRLLTMMVVIGAVAYAGFIFFLLKVAG